mmetsp:Transcript_38961/g.83927  ORF Transcript_38961/g.83927 Transcript_38961/m.83927 type:complete len:560 (-) Transcript_38961:3968-5647(-)
MMQKIGNNGHSPLATKEEEEDNIHNYDNTEIALPERVAFRPRWLYSAIFVWNTLSVGKFTAPLLQQLSPKFTDSMIGFTFALQYGIVACLAGWGGSMSDNQERIVSSSSSSSSPWTSCWGWGRVKVLLYAIALGTMAFLGHALPPYMEDLSFFPNNKTTFVLLWHISMRCIYAISFGIIAPTLDGLVLAHLECIGANSTDFGKERMYGALLWGLGTLSAGVGIDYYGFEFLYEMCVVSMVASYGVIGMYIWGISRDTTGAFKSRVNTTIVEDGNNKSSESEECEYQHEVVEYDDEEEKEEENDSILSNTELLFIVFQTGYGKALLFLVFTISMGISVVDNLAFLFFDSLGASSTMDGWSVLSTVLFEIPMFYVSPILLERYGPGKLLIAAGFAYVVRVIGYTLVPANESYTMYIILMLETLHGVSYAGSKTGSVEFIARMMPEGYEASGQGILIFVTYFGVVAGLVMAGWIQETLGGYVMFRVMAGIVSVGMMMFLLAERFCDKTHIMDATKEKDEDETCHLVKSESAASSASAFADVETERYIKNLKYDSLNKWVKDW